MQKLSAAVPDEDVDPVEYHGEYVKNKDPKTKLNHFCQRYVGRMVLKGDVVYKSGKVAGTDMFQATVQMFCMEGGPVFAGELAKDKRSSEQEAAKQALAAYAEEAEKLEKNPHCFRSGGGKTPKATFDYEVCRLWKTRLHEIVSRICKKSITKGDIVFVTERQADSSYVTSLTVPTMEGVWGTQEFLSEPARNGKDGEQLAAQKAVEAMYEAPEFEEVVNQIKDKENALGKDPLDPHAKKEVDPKTALNMFCQRWTGRIITKGDVIYSSIQVQGIDGGVAFQSTVQCFCMQDEPCFAGEPHAVKKNAEFEAAKVALEAFAPELEQLNGMKKRTRTEVNKDRRDRKREAEGRPPPEPTPKKKKEKTEPGFPYKSRLFELLMKVVRKALTKDDVCYNTKKQGDGEFICTLTFPCMQGTWGTTPFVSEKYDTIKEAELNASQKAFIKMRQDPSFQQYVSMLEKGQKHISPSRIANQNKSRGFVGRAKNGGVLDKMERRVSHATSVEFGKSSYVTSSGAGTGSTLW